MDAKIFGQKVDEERNIHIVLKFLPSDYLLIAKGKIYFYSGSQVTALTK